MKGPKDHYVAQTYLRSFSVSGRDGFVNAVRKNDLKLLNRIPVDSICYKPNWSTNSYFSKQPRAIEDFLKPFESNWPNCIKALADEDFNAETKYFMSGYIAYLKTYTPTAARLGKEFPAEIVRQRYDILAKAEMGKPDSQYAAIIKKIQNGGGIIVNVKDDFVKAMGASNLEDLIRGYLFFPWLILMNDTSIPFITSDNPVCSHWSRFSVPDFYFPVTPKIAVLIRPTRDLNVEIPDSLVSINSKGVEMFNGLVAQCAETMVIFNRDFGVKELVKKFQDWRMETLVASQKQGSRTMVFCQERPLRRASGDERH